MTYRIILVLEFILLFHQGTVAQVTFQRIFRGSQSGYEVQPTSDGGYAMTFMTYLFGAGMADVYLIKTDSLGITQWAKTYGAAANDVGYSLQQTSDGGYIIAGFTESFGAGGRDVLVVKTDASGNLAWSKAYGGQGYDYANCVKQTSDGGYIIVGYTTSFGLPNGNTFLVKTDGNGTVIWVKTIYSISYGGEIYSVRQTTDGGFILGGTLGGSAGASSEMGLIKTDSSGNVAWMKIYGGPAGDFGYYAIQTTDGGYMLAGQTESFGAGMFDAIVVKTDSVGSYLWARTYGDSTNNRFMCIQQTSDSGYVMAGSTHNSGPALSDFQLVRIDSSGTQLWAKTYGGVEYNEGKFVAITPDNGFVISGMTGNFGGNFYTHLVKTDANGNSGCNESNLVPVVSTPTIQVSDIISYTTLGCLVASPVYTVGSWGSDSTICYTVAFQEEFQASQFLVAPNPFTCEVRITGLHPTRNATITIRDVLGQTVFVMPDAQMDPALSRSLQLGFLSAGIYFLNVTTDGSRTVQKIIKE